MPPFVYRSLKDFMRASATAQTRQELLRKLITNAAKRKTQTHLDATGARMSTFPEMFGRSLAADMGKQAFVGAGLKMVGRGISNFARNQLSGGLGKFVGNIGNGVRGLGTQTQRAGLRLGNAAQPLVNEVKDMSNKVINRGVDAIDRLPSWALPAASGVVVGGRVATDIHNDRELRRPSPLLQNKPLPQQGGLMANPIQETYSMNMGKQSMNKQANMALLRQILSPAMKQLRGYGANALSAAGRGGSRYMELLSGNKLKNMTHRYEHLMNMFGDYPTKNMMNQHGQIGYDVAANANGVLTDLQHKALREAIKVYGTRAGTVGAGSLATAGGLAGIGRMQQGNNQPMLAKKSMTMPQPTSRGTVKKVQMPEASPSKPDCDPEGVQMSNNKQAFLTGASIGALGGLATSKPGQRASGIGRGALIGGGTELGAVGGAGFGGMTGTALGALLGGLISRKPEGAMTGAGLGGLTGAVLGAGGGGYAGHIGTKALLDSQQDKDVSPKSQKSDKKTDKEDDKEVKEAAAVVLAQLKRNHTK